MAEDSIVKQRAEADFVEAMSNPRDARTQKLLSRLLKCLETNWSRIVHLEDELESGGADGSSKFPQAILISCRDSTWEFDLTDPEIHNDREILDDAGAFMRMIMDNIAYHLEIPHDHQAFFTRQGTPIDIGCRESVSRALSGRRPLLRVEDSTQAHGASPAHGSSPASPNGTRKETSRKDLDSMGAPLEPEPVTRRILKVMFQGQEHKWLDVEEIERVSSGYADVDKLLRENIERHFGIPVEHQDIMDQHDRIKSSADFLRVLQSVDPRLKLYDLRTMHTSIGSPFKQVHEAPLSNSASSVIQQPRVTFAPEQEPVYMRGNLRPEASQLGRGWASGGYSNGYQGQQRRFARAATFDNQTKPLGWSQGRVEVELRKDKPGDIFGFAIEHDKEYRFLYVGTVVNDGLLWKWNRDNAVFSLREGDAILEVNNVANDSRAMEWVLKQSSHVRLECQRR